MMNFETSYQQLKMNAADYKQLFIGNRENGFEHPDMVAKMNAMTDTEIETFLVYELGILETREVREIVDLWYDEYERYNGDGYYPLTKQDTPCDMRETHVFQKELNCWKQITGDPISGLDGDAGIQLLDILNANGSNCITIKNSFGRTLYSKKVKVYPVIDGI